MKAVKQRPISEDSGFDSRRVSQLLQGYHDRKGDCVTTQSREISDPRWESNPLPSDYRSDTVPLRNH